MPAPIGLTPLPPVEAIRAARAQTSVLPAVYYGEMAAAARQAAFTVSGLASIAQIEAVRQSMVTAIASGESFAAWQARVQAGEVPLGLNPARREVIFRNNVQGAYNRGRWQRMRDRTRTHPFWMYDAVNDSRTRPTHAAMDNTILRHDHPWWATHYPPLGHQCRCRVIALTTAEAERRGITATPTGTKPDEGWGYSPGDAPLQGIAQSAQRVRASPAGALYRERLAAIDAALAEPRDLLAELQRTIGAGPFAIYVNELRQAAALAGVSIEAAVAVRAYTGNTFYRDVNATMRYIGSSRGASIDGVRDPERLLPIISGLFRFFAEAPALQTKVTRMLKADRLPASFVRDHRPGSVVAYESVTSASAPGGEFPAGDVVLTILQRSGRAAQSFSPYGAKEREIMIPPGTLFEVVSRRKVKGRMMISVREIERADVRGRQVYHFSHG